MKTLRLVFTLLVMIVAGLVTIPTQRTRAQGASYASVINASNGQFQYTGALAITSEKDLRDAAAASSTNGVAILIGNGSGDPFEPITDIQIVGIGGVAYGYLTECPPREE